MPVEPPLRAEFVEILEPQRGIAMIDGDHSTVDARQSNRVAVSNIDAQAHVASMDPAARDSTEGNELDRMVVAGEVRCRVLSRLRVEERELEEPSVERRSGRFFSVE